MDNFNKKFKIYYILYKFRIAYDYLKCKYECAWILQEL